MARPQLLHQYDDAKRKVMATLTTTTTIVIIIPSHDAALISFLLFLYIMEVARKLMAVDAISITRNCAPIDTWSPFLHQENLDVVYFIHYFN